MRCLSLIFTLLLAAFPAYAGELPRVVSGEAAGTALTIYPDNLALITETRTVDLPKGKSTIVFEGVSDRMIPASVLLREFTGLTVERNFDYARLNKANLFAKSIGSVVTITRTDNRSGAVTRQRAEIMSAGQGVVFKIGNRFEVLQCSGLSEGTQFENLPEGLNDVPELSLDVETQKAGTQELVISYLADNFSWEADYRMDVAKDERSAKLVGWLTINNQTAKSFKDAPLAIIAGSLNRSHQTRAPNHVNKGLYANCWPSQSTQTPVPILERFEQYDTKSDYLEQRVQYSPMAMMKGASNDEIIVTGSGGKREVKQEDLGDYKLYRISEPVTVAAYQTKQIRFINADDAKIDKIYTLDVFLDEYFNKQNTLKMTSIEYRINNDKDGDIAKPLPKGTMLVFDTSNDGHRRVVGETNVRDTAIGNPMKVYLDRSFLVQVDTHHVRRKIGRIRGGAKIQVDVKHTLTNASDKAAVVEINMPAAYTSLKISRATKMRDASVGPNGWSLFVRPHATATLKYRANFIE